MQGCFVHCWQEPVSAKGKQAPVMLAMKELSLLCRIKREDMKESGSFSQEVSVFNSEIYLTFKPTYPSGETFIY